MNYQSVYKAIWINLIFYLFDIYFLFGENMTNVRRTKLDPSIVKELQSSRLLASQAITQSRIS